MAVGLFCSALMTVGAVIFPEPEDSSSQTMSKTCQITGRGTRAGGSLARRGLAKKDGGVGLRTTGHNKRTFQVNVQRKRIWVPELGKYVRVRLSTRAMKTVQKNGAYPTLLKAGLIKAVGKKSS